MPCCSTRHARSRSSAPDEQGLRPLPAAIPRWTWALAAAHGWAVRQDGTRWRRVVASPEPAQLLDLPAVRLLLGTGAIVVCAGGGGIPVVDEAGSVRGVEAVVDKDLTASLLAASWAPTRCCCSPTSRRSWTGTGPRRPGRSGGLRPPRCARDFPAGSMGPKIDAVCRFVEATGRPAAIRQLADAQALLAQQAGTIVVPD